MNLQRNHIAVIPVPAYAGINLRAGTQTGQIRSARSLARIKEFQGLGSRLRGNDKPTSGTAV